MTIELKEGDVLTSTSQVIAHQVNCKGVMGAGLAKQIKEKYPKVFDWYSNVIKSRGEMILGSCQLVPISTTQFIANLFAQLSYGREGRYTNYQALEESLLLLKKAMNTKSLNSLSIPYGMSCGLAGGDWDTVLGIINKVFEDSDISIEVWKL